MCHVPDRRRFLGRLAATGFVLTPLAAALSACSANGRWPEGMAEIKWDRDTCTRCSMVISNRRFAAEVRGGPNDAVYKFDDIGCAAFWLKSQAWAREARIWVADATGRGEAPSWLDARKAHYVGGKSSPMGYNHAAQALPQAGSLAFDEMVEHVLARGK